MPTIIRTFIFHTYGSFQTVFISVFLFLYCMLINCMLISIRIFFPECKNDISLYQNHVVFSSVCHWVQFKYGPKRIWYKNEIEDSFIQMAFAFYIIVDMWNNSYTNVSIYGKWLLKASCLSPHRVSKIATESQK